MPSTRKRAVKKKPAKKGQARRKIAAKDKAQVEVDAKAAEEAEKKAHEIRLKRVLAGIPRIAEYIPALGGNDAFTQSNTKRSVTIITNNLQTAIDRIGDLRKGMDDEAFTEGERLIRDANTALSEVRTTEIPRSLRRWQYTQPLEEGHIKEELMQIDRDFEGNWSVSSNKLKVTTSDIVMRGVNFNSFRMEIKLDYLKAFLESGSSDNRVSMISIHALDPNCGQDGGYSHPHVTSTRLCEGDATTPLTQASKAVRLADIFTILDATLRTYNPGSPYQKIENWTTEVDCVDCNEMMNTSRGCNICGGSVCKSCFNRCPNHESCGANRLCSSHSRKCPSCSNTYCHRCTDYQCRTCGTRSCRTCLPGGSVCTNCNSKEEDRLVQQAEEREQRRASGATAPPSPRPPTSGTSSGTGSLW